MSLQAGTRLGVFEILAPVGAGGMGEVYRARDTKLDREVAVKVLPEAFAADPDRLARFDREARSLAALLKTPSAPGTATKASPSASQAAAETKHQATNRARPSALMPVRSGPRTSCSPAPC